MLVKNLLAKRASAASLRLRNVSLGNQRGGIFRSKFGRLLMTEHTDQRNPTDRRSPERRSEATEIGITVERRVTERRKFERRQTD
jgi:hypothetical protein